MYMPLKSVAWGRECTVVTSYHDTDLRHFSVSSVRSYGLCNECTSSSNMNTWSSECGNATEYTAVSQKRCRYLQTLGFSATAVLSTLDAEKVIEYLGSLNGLVYVWLTYCCIFFFEHLEVLISTTCANCLASSTVPGQYGNAHL